MKAVILASVLFLVFLASSTWAHKGAENNQFLRRLIRGANARKKDCRYEKEPWEDCDPSTGTQKRTLRLKTNARTPLANCESVLNDTRPCKKACRYIKGEWTECLNGKRTRTDTLNRDGSSGASTAGCAPTRAITKECKQKQACRYKKSDWSPCENGRKNKTLTLVEGTNCEDGKLITKECGKRVKQGRQRGGGNGARKNGGQTMS